MKRIPANDGSQPEARATRSSLTFAGLQAFLEQIVEDISRLTLENRFNPAATLKIVRDTAQRLETSITRTDARPDQFTSRSRSLLGWFCYFAVPEHFQRYHAAVRRAQIMFSTLPATIKDWRSPVLVRFIPGQQMFHWRVRRSDTQVSLPAPMIDFDDELLTLVARQMTGDRQARLRIIDAMLSPSYQAMLQAFELAAGGAVEHTRGAVYDLVEIFDRVNARYFTSTVARPRLAWSRGLSRSIFGHYHPVQDKITISLALDNEDVPAFVLDHVMHHEMLHKKLGMERRGGRQHAHTAQFRRQERAFEKFAEASAILGMLSRR